MIITKINTIVYSYDHHGKLILLFTKLWLLRSLRKLVGLLWFAPMIITKIIISKINAIIHYRDYYEN